MVAYNNDIPDQPNNPSVDAPKMKINTNAVDTILAVDHISFNANNGGTHKQITHETLSPGSLLGGSSASTVFPAQGQLDATKAQYYFRNATNTFILSALKAFALVTGNTGAIPGLQNFNCTVVRNSVGNYTVTMTANATTSANSTNYSVFVQVLAGASGFPNIQVQKTSATTFNILTQQYNLTTLVQADFTQFCFAVLQW